MTLLDDLLYIREALENTSSALQAAKQLGFENGEPIEEALQTATRSLRATLDHRIAIVDVDLLIDCLHALHRLQASKLIGQSGQDMGRRACRDAIAAFHELNGGEQ